ASLLADMPAPSGVLGRHRPDADDDADIAVGLAAARRLGALDIGQAAVVQQGGVLALEDVEATDVLIGPAGALKRPGRGPILVKVCKPQQEVRADPPVIGPDTIRRAVAAGFAGIAVDAGGTLVLDRSETVGLADAAGLFLVGIDVG